MTREETLTIMAVLKAAYPSYYAKMKRRDAENAVALWSEMLADEPAELVAMAVKAMIASDRTGYPPHIGAVMDAITKLKSPDTRTALEAWTLVRKAISNASMRRESRIMRDGVLDPRTSAERNFDELPKELQRLVGSPAQLAMWAEMDTNTLNSVIASNFQKSYKVIAAREWERQALPDDVKRFTEALSAGMAMASLPEKCE